MTILTVLHSVEIFEGLSEDELIQIGEICKQINIQSGHTITTQDTFGDELFIVAEGFVEVRVVTPGKESARSVVNLGPGQLVGEMVLVDKGLRSATTISLSDPTILYRINHIELENLFEHNTNIGYKVMRNIASDLSFKLRHHNMQTE
jgi:CRP-like cAMP-binding protein